MPLQRAIDPGVADVFRAAHEDPADPPRGSAPAALTIIGTPATGMSGFGSGVAGIDKPLTGARHRNPI